ncbi:alkyl sulfatase dimerization domain-containing protein [Fontimonas sp. SYSU GA230001]|uniref:alkyl/aryl-sulfatase n=1 Tax=Fontimonas sp. SYSU GA230001 TaxID=3142450 RepID=UPI0032B34CC4
MNIRSWLAVVLLCTTGCKPQQPVVSGDATATTRAVNASFAKVLKLDDRQDFDDAARGLIARPQGKIVGADGSVLMDFDAWTYIQGPAPDTVNPSLWRHAQLNGQVGLFKVRDGIHQLRGFDIANMTLIDGRSGWIVVDPLTAKESAAAAIAFARKHLGDKPVSAVIFTHSHIDHFGGVLGVLSAEEAAARGVPIIAPQGFLEEATSENVLVGTAMGRRSTYQFGRSLPRSATGLVDAGLGRAVVYGTFGILTPTQTITQPTQELDVDGLRFVFHNVPHSEAPAELTFSIPELKAYCGAEILAQTMHNLLPIRGAKVRDTLLWSNYLDQALDHAAGAEVAFMSHNWPVWEAARIREFITKHRDVYRYTHDQTVRLMNAGYTAPQIAERVKLPDSLASYFGTRGYYGDLRHNVKAVYQHYLGIYDGNPAHLDPLPPEDVSRRYVEAMGGAAKVIVTAREAYARGEYRWAAELLNHVMFAQPRADGAAALLADTYEQMGYVAESATWRNSYLTAASELRHGIPDSGGLDRTKLLDVLAHTPVERFLDAMAGNLDGPAAANLSLSINLVLKDTGQSYVLWLENGVLHHRAAARDPTANATLELTKNLFLKMMVGNAGVGDMLLGDELSVRGSRVDLVRFFSLFDKPDGRFAIVSK